MRIVPVGYVKYEPTSHSHKNKKRAYLMEPDEFQVWANARGNKPKREWKFLLDRSRWVEKRSLVRRSRHCKKGKRSGLKSKM